MFFSINEFQCTNVNKFTYMPKKTRLIRSPKTNSRNLNDSISVNWFSHFLCKDQVAHVELTHFFSCRFEDEIHGFKETTFVINKFFSLKPVDWMLDLA